VRRGSQDVRSVGRRVLACWGRNAMISPAELTDQDPLADATLDLELIRKYAVPGPRYTSYPPATRFGSDFAALDLPRALAEDNAPGAGPLSLYFHLPFCSARCWYCGCHTIITRRQEVADTYLDDLEREVALTARQIDLARPVAQLHLGGGTPTFLTPAQLTRLGQIVRNTFTFAPEAEIGVEIDPRCLDRGQVDALLAMGMNRASLGVQDTNPAVQVAIHRIQPHALNQQAFGWLREAGVASINVDLIYGLPLQTEASLEATFDEVLALGPDRLSLFSYAHVPWIKPAQRIFDRNGQLPSPALKLRMFARLHERLRRAGYVDVGLDHFARPDDELARALADGSMHRNFQGYSTRGGASLYGFGISSISQTADTYRQNHKSLADYRISLTAGVLPVERGYRLNRDDLRRRALIMGLMCERRIDFAAQDRAMGGDLRQDFAREIAALAPLQADGLVSVGTDGIEVLPAGVPLLRVIAMCFDASQSAAPGRHALTV
jgi:oxygen-independent coproporphyrinogen-3 oxidase